MTHLIEMKYDSEDLKIMETPPSSGNICGVHQLLSFKVLKLPVNRFPFTLVHFKFSFQCSSPFSLSLSYICVA